MRPIGSPQELERRRHRAVALMAQGESPTLLARILGVNRNTLYRWKAQAQQPQGLKATPHPGPTPGLNADQLIELEGLLLAGATAHGWSNELWTAPRVQVVIQRHFGLDYHPDYVRRLLKRRLGWTSQKPEYRATQRNEAAIEAWRQTTIQVLKKTSPSH